MEASSDVGPSEACHTQMGKEFPSKGDARSQGRGCAVHMCNRVDRKGYKALNGPESKACKGGNILYDTRALRFGPDL